MSNNAIVTTSDEEMLRLFDPLYDVFASAGSGSQPLLAHYTSIQVMESILKNSEIWFSNPLFMNDLQEMKFGLYEGTRFFSNIEQLKKAGGNEARAEILQRSYFQSFNHFDVNEAFDTYIFCLAEHDPSDNDGLLSMWRGYGQHGNGAAIVFDPSKITLVPTSPLLFSKVSYVRGDERAAQVQSNLDSWVELTARLDLPDEKLHLAAYAAFSLVKGLALVTKHSGFSEEKEWRVVYNPGRDTTGALKPFLNYHIGNRGVEPKLKYQVGHLANVSAPDLALERLIDRIILGPSLASPLALRSVQRMLDNIRKPHYKPLLRPSTIPLRPNSGSSF
ncbi:MAG TPA: DUF2971 domain-containing protein [Rhizomicrobium sp.]